MNTETYTETVLRYRVVRRQIITDEAIRAEYRINGRDPDDTWSLIWSFNDQVSADDQAEDEREIFKFPRWEVKVIDAGETTYIKRSIW
jgi:hypothetical protein